MLFRSIFMNAACRGVSEPRTKLREYDRRGSVLLRNETGTTGTAKGQKGQMLIRSSIRNGRNERVLLVLDDTGFKRLVQKI